MKSEDYKVTAVAVVYGNRWNLLREVIKETLKETRVTNFIISDNGCHEKDEMFNFCKTYNNRINIISHGSNLGYSAAIKSGLIAARETDCTHVFVLDDDCVPEENFLDYFISNLKLFPDEEKIVLAANRRNVPGYDKIFYESKVRDTKVYGTLFEVFKLSKIFNIVKNKFVRGSEIKTFTPIIPSSAFVTGGSLMPIKAVREAPLPDENLFMYGEDLKYAWGVRALGYESYLCYRPFIEDTDMTFDSEKGSHIYGLFQEKTPDYKVYLRLRNSIKISREYSYQNKFSLFINVVAWFFGLILIGAVKTKLNKVYFKRLKIIKDAFIGGYRKDYIIPDYIQTPK